MVRGVEGVSLREGVEGREEDGVREPDVDGVSNAAARSNRPERDGV